MPKLFCINNNLKLPLYTKFVRLFKENCVKWKTKIGEKKKVIWKGCFLETSEAQIIWLFKTTLREIVGPEHLHKEKNIWRQVSV